MQINVTPIQHSLCHLMMLNMIVGKYMLENISVVCTYQTQKLSGILRRNSYITTYNMYKKI